MKQQILCVGLMILSPMVMAKTSWGISIEVPIVQQSTTTYSVQHLPASVPAQQHMQTTIRHLPTSTVLQDRQNVVVHPFKPMSAQEYQQYRTQQAPVVIYQAPVVYYSSANVQPITQVITQTHGNALYAPQTTTIVQQTHLPSSLRLNVGDVIPMNYRQMNYWVNDWQNYQLSAPPKGYLWLNLGGQFALVSQPNYVIVNLQR
ncbi:RcnB family protein [Moraxella sp. ZY210820]|uniref:RcnB family protein n=1 Tax=unclassified Moraxella TaxID=2685852 RepID=UPI002731B2A5|nr:RcnB family protein [Moraxella sp. ZY210820]WLF83156.1 RcnB family protein [Moraxella sp. ZY210820]